MKKKIPKTFFLGLRRLYLLLALHQVSCHFISARGPRRSHTWHSPDLVGTIDRIADELCL